MLSSVRQILPRVIRPTAMLTNVRFNTTGGDKSKTAANVPNELWNLGKLNHLAIAVPNLEKASAFYKNIMQAKTVSEPVPLKEHGVYTVFVDLGNTKIELLHPLGDKSPIKNFLEKNKDGGIHHICIEVDNIDNAIKDIQKHRIRTLSEKPRIGAHGKPVMFLHPKDCGGVLVELEQA